MKKHINGKIYVKVLFSAKIIVILSLSSIFTRYERKKNISSEITEKNVILHSLCDFTFIV